jgi:serine protease Do
LSFAPLVREAAPAVVNVYTRTVVKPTARSSMFDDPFFKRFFGDLIPQMPQRRRDANSLGSGVIIDPSGLIVTNAHVVKGADTITVVLADRRELEASLLLEDAKTDLAILRVDAGGPLPFVEMRDSDSLEVGDLVLAIGNPFGVGQTVTMGIVSALARTNVGIGDYSFFIQTDASINPGNSGGALIGVDGKLVGVNTAIYSANRGPSAGSVGIGFAVPSNMVRTVVRAAEDGKIVRPWLGARAQSVDSDMAASFGLGRPQGAVVTEVFAGGPADRAGLKVRDVVLAVEGREVRDFGALRYRIATRSPGDRVSFEVLRDGVRLQLDIPMEAPSARPAPDITDIGSGSPFNGTRVANLSPAFALEQGFDDMSRGVIILALARGSPAERLGLRRGDQIIAVNGTAISAVDDLVRATKADARAWDIAIRRDGKQLTAKVRDQ